MNTHTIVADIRRDMSKILQDAGNQNRMVRDVYF